MEVEEPLRVLTLNTWGLLYISKDLEERMSAIADELAKGRYHLVHLQEVWSHRHFQLIEQRVKSVLPYAHYFHSGLIGSGCATFSHYPIIDTFFHKFSHNGYFWDVLHGDWYGGKGVGVAVIQHPDSTIHSFNTHLHADYPGGLSSGLAECRMLQIYQLVQCLRHTTRPGDRIILTGDMNHTSDSLGMEAFCTLSGLKDTYVTADTKPEECFTLNTNTNKYVPEGEVTSRIDFIFTSDNMACTSCNLAMQQIPGTDIHYADHEGYTASVKFKPGSHASQDEQESDRSLDMLHRLHDVVKQGEQLAEEVHWKKVASLALVFFLLLVVPVWSLDTFHSLFPPISTWCGKCVFVAQMVCAVASLVYFWVITYIRQTDGKIFKSVCADIEIRTRALEMLHKGKSSSS